MLHWIVLFTAVLTIGFLPAEVLAFQGGRLVVLRCRTVGDTCREGTRCGGILSGPTTVLTRPVCLGVDIPLMAALQGTQQWRTVTQTFIRAADDVALLKLDAPFDEDDLDIIDPQFDTPDSVLGTDVVELQSQPEPERAANRDVQTLVFLDFLKLLLVVSSLGGVSFAFCCLLYFVKG